MNHLNWKLLIKVGCLMACILTFIGAKSFNKQEGSFSMSYLKGEQEHLLNKKYAINSQLDNLSGSDNEIVNLLLENWRLERAQEINQHQRSLEYTKQRYTKGLEIVRLMYEKILALDHHFSSLKAWGEINQICNPVNYPEYAQLNEKLDKSIKRRSFIKLPDFVKSNPFMEGAIAISSLLFVDGKSSKISTEEMEQLACILDFTMKMDSDMKIIYYETEYLKKGNEDLIAELSRLFADYTKVVDYIVPIAEARKNDDWRSIVDRINHKTNQMMIVLAQPDENMYKPVFRDQLDMEFAIKQLFEFLDDYATFIKQGERYYQKFEVILGNYSNEAVCLEQLPKQYRDLSSNIGIAIQKFQEAYSINEINGSKLKDMMFGFDEN